MKYLLATIRFVLFVVSTLVLYWLWWVTSFVIPNKVYWRQLAFEFWTKSYVRISGMRIEVIGQPPTPPFFLVSNHVSYADIAALRAVVKGVFVAKHEINDWFLAGRIVRDMGIVFIDRKNRRDIPRAGKEIIDRLSSGEGVIVFPEGTSTKGEEILPFNSSFLEFAARTDLPVSYVSISYRTPEGGPTASESICWWDDTPFLHHMFRSFMLPQYTAILNFGDEPVMNTDRKRLAAELHERVSERFIPIV
ncbi:MAG: lysophospholipid acyltransferase family protein [Pyrinomonadaceae bacterium]|nr:lysophospholipid acyltransferase family protein [Pyrinomonadaceae bacterium]